MLKEEKVLKHYLNSAIDVKLWIPQSSRLIGKLVRALQADAIECYHDWESRPRECAGVTFPDAVRGNKRWRETAAIRGRK